MAPERVGRDGGGYNRTLAQRGAFAMGQSPPNSAQGNRAGARRLGRRLLLAALGAGLLWLAWTGYSQPAMLLQLVNLRYCG